MGRLGSNLVSTRLTVDYFSIDFATNAIILISGQILYIRFQLNFY